MGLNSATFLPFVSNGLLPDEWLSGESNRLFIERGVLMIKRIFDLGIGVLLGSYLAVAGLAHGQPQAANSSRGAVFAATNGVNRNEIVMYARLPTGKLQWVGKFETGGRGQGGINDPLQSQNSVVITPDHSFLLAVKQGRAAFRYSGFWMTPSCW